MKTCLKSLYDEILNIMDLGLVIPSLLVIIKSANIILIVKLYFFFNIAIAKILTFIQKSFVAYSGHASGYKELEYKS